MAEVRRSDNPGAWLMAAAKHRAIDHFRRNQRLDRKHEELGREGVTQKVGIREVRAGEAQMNRTRTKCSTTTSATTCSV